MKTQVVLAAALVSPFIANAQTATESGFYFRIDAGVSLVEDVEGVSDNLFGLTATNFELTLDPGFRGDLAPGYNFNRYVGLEFNTGVIWNTFDTIEVEDGTSFTGDGILLQIPILANVLLRYPTDFHLTPFIGVGAGFVFVSKHVDADHGIDINDGGDDVFGAVQLSTGLQYKLTEMLNLGLVYKYLHVFSDENSSDGQSESFGALTTHSLSALVRIHL